VVELALVEVDADDDENQLNNPQLLLLTLLDVVEVFNSFAAAAALTPLLALDSIDDERRTVVVMR
jgi:hypothetical protein